MHILAVRHGQTNHNKENRIMGQGVDEPLNKTGQEQALTLLAELEKHTLYAIYASPMQRTKQTAEIINEKLNLPIEFIDDLKERDVGSLAGKTYEQVSEIISEDAYKGEIYDYRPYGGESVEEVSKRVDRFVDYITRQYSKPDDENKKVLVVTHGGIITLLYKHFGKPMIQDAHNVCVHEF